jgi:hypothetical protein
MLEVRFKGSNFASSHARPATTLNLGGEGGASNDHTTLKPAAQAGGHVPSLNWQNFFRQQSGNMNLRAFV